MSRSNRTAAGWHLFGLAYNLLAGFTVGLLAPVAGLAGMVGGVYLVTGKVPFLGHIYEDEAGRRLSLKLVSPEEAQDLAVTYKEQFGDDWARMQEQIRALSQEAKAKTAQATPVTEG
jgi:hypothetical protein